MNFLADPSLFKEFWCSRHGVFLAEPPYSKNFLADAPADRPWCCVASYYEPNEAMVVGREAYSLYDVDHLALPINLRDDLSDRPNFYRRQQQIFAGLGDDEWRHALACYYGRISEIDLQLGG